jgi:hypothetical protein
MSNIWVFKLIILFHHQHSNKRKIKLADSNTRGGLFCQKQTLKLSKGLHSGRRGKKLSKNSRSTFSIKNKINSNLKDRHSSSQLSKKTKTSKFNTFLIITFRAHNYKIKIC